MSEEKHECNDCPCDECMEEQESEQPNYIKSEDWDEDWKNAEELVRYFIKEVRRLRAKIKETRKEFEEYKYWNDIEDDEYD